MKILYLTKGDHIDYQNDCLLIGLKELLGCNVIDYNKQDHNYITYDEQEARKLYGMGMTMTRVLPDLEVDRTDIISKIKNKYFDFIIYGSIWRYHNYIAEVLQHYEPSRVIAVDGEDHTSIHDSFNLGIQYFKRELIHKAVRLNPISFSIPTSKVNFNKNKTKDAAYITPLDSSTYIYKNEKDYYNDYNEARFGITVKKAGWDCMRHYEILANGCIPRFLDIDGCPEMTMYDFPKDLCKEVNLLLKTLSPQDVYNRMIYKFEEHFQANNTTSKVAEGVINKICKAK